MSGNPKDDEHDTQVDSAWRRQFGEEPSAMLDASIRAAARREAAKAQGQRSRRGWDRWVPLAAAAGVGALAFGLVRWLPVDQGPTIEVQSRASEPAAAAQPPPAESLGGAAAPVPEADRAHESSAEVELKAKAADTPAAAPAALERRGHATGPSIAESKVDDRTEAIQERQKAPGAPPPVFAPTPSAEAVQESAPAGVASQSNAADASVTVTSAKAAQRADQIDRSAAVQRIVDLHAAGRLDEAAEALRALRAIEPHADEHLPAELRGWATTVKSRD